MQFDLSRFRGPSERLERRYEPSAFPWRNEEFRLAGPVDLVVEIRKDGQKVSVAGRVTAGLECDCSRCLEPYPVPVDASFDLLYLPASENTGEPEQEMDQDDVGVSYYRDEVIDLAELMREQFYLALPMKPLCSEACRGLCPVCGVNRNRETCDCVTTWADPRLEPLRKLKKGS